MRYKDLDLLEGIFKVWTSEGREALDVKKARDVRLRQLLQSRIENMVSKQIYIIYRSIMKSDNQRQSRFMPQTILLESRF